MMMSKLNKTDTYQGYLLRFWRRDSSQSWRVTVECISTRERHHFATVDKALSFIQAQLDWSKTDPLSN